MDTLLASLAATSSSSPFSSASSAPVLSAPLLSAPFLSAANATANATTTLPWAQRTAPLAVAGFCSCVALVVSCWHIGMHLTYYRNPEAQRSIVRILMIVPLYSMSSFVALVAEDVGLYFELIRDIYEAYVIYLFLCLIISFAGGDSICASGMRERGAMRHPWPLCCLPHLRIGARFLRQCKQLTLQFVVLKPIMAFTSIIMLIAQKYYDAGYQTTLLIIYNVAYTLALGALGYFYMGCRGAISGHGLPFKFVSIKLVVFLTYWQGLVVELLPLEKEETRALNNFILCVEMMLFALLHQRAFPVSEFRGAVSSDKMAEKVGSVFSMKDVVKDAKDSFSARGVTPIEGFRGAALLSEDQRIPGQQSQLSVQPFGQDFEQI